MGNAKKKAVGISKSQFDPAEVHRLHYMIVAKPGQSIEDIMEPTAWATISPMLRPWARVDVIAEDGSYVAELFVVQVSKLWVRTALVNLTDLSGEDQKEDDGSNDPYYVKYRGTIKKYCVVRRADDSNVSEGMDSREDASKSLIDYEKALAR